MLNTFSFSTFFSVTHPSLYQHFPENFWANLSLSLSPSLSLSLTLSLYLYSNSLIQMEFISQTSYYTTAGITLSRPFSFVPSSVTGFGEISPFWQTFKIIWQYFEGLFSIWRNFERSLANLVCFWANFYCRD